jgi:transposase
VEDWAEIRRLHRAEGMPIKVIARVVGCSRNTVRAALAAEGPPKYVRRPVGSVVDEVEPRVRELLATLCVPETLHRSRDLLILVEQPTEPVAPSDAFCRARRSLGEWS